MEPSLSKKKSSKLVEEIIICKLLMIVELHWMNLLVGSFKVDHFNLENKMGEYGVMFYVSIAGSKITPYNVDESLKIMPRSCWTCCFPFSYAFGYLA